MIYHLREVRSYSPQDSQLRQCTLGKVGGFQFVSRSKQQDGIAMLSLGPLMRGVDHAATAAVDGLDVWRDVENTTVVGNVRNSLVLANEITPF